jgi:outer membrane protein TolC
MKKTYMKKYLFVWLLLINITAISQIDSLSLNQSIGLVRTNYPLLNQNDYYKLIGESNQQIIQNEWLPRVNLTGQATYQSEVSKFSFPGLPGIILPKNQYNIGLIVRQNVIDGGKSQQARRVEELSTAVAVQQNETNLYTLASRTNELYGNILLARENLRILALYKQDVQNNEKLVRSALKNGTALQSNLDVLTAQELTTDQNIIETVSNLKGLYQSFSLLLKRPLTDSTSFTSDISLQQNRTDSLSRPETQLYGLQRQLLDARIKQIQKDAIPTVQVFGEGNYGRPGYDFLRTNMGLYGRVGLSVNWNIASLYNRNTQKKNLQVNKQLLDAQEAAFNLNTNATLVSQSTEIEKLRSIIEKDRQIVEVRTRVTRTASIQLENGIITSTDYLTELDKEMQARMNQKVHEVRLMTAINNYNITKGVAIN